MKYTMAAAVILSHLHIVSAYAQYDVDSYQSDAPTVNLPVKGTKEFSLSGAGSSDRDFDSNIFSLEASYGWYLSPIHQMGVRQSISVADQDSVDAKWNGSTRVFYDYHFGNGRGRPYVGANLGYVYGDSVEESFLAGLEGGVKYYVSNSTFIVGQIEYQYLFDEANDLGDRFDDGSFVYSVGMGYNF